MSCRNCKHLFVNELKCKTTHRCRNRRINLTEVGFFRWLVGCKGKEKYEGKSI